MVQCKSVSFVPQLSDPSFQADCCPLQAAAVFTAPARSVGGHCDTRALLGHRYLDEQRAERALGARAGGGGDRAGWPEEQQRSFEVSEMEMVKQTDLPERREVGAANQQVSTDPPTFQSTLCAQPLTR